MEFVIIEKIILDCPHDIDQYDCRTYCLWKMKLDINVIITWSSQAQQPVDKQILWSI